MKDILNQLIEHKTLSQQQAKEVLKNLATGCACFGERGFRQRFKVIIQARKIR